MYQIKIFFLNSFSFKVDVGDGVYSEHFKVIMHVTAYKNLINYLIYKTPYTLSLILMIRDDQRTMRGISLAFNHV